VERSRYQKRKVEWSFSLSGSTIIGQRHDDVGICQWSEDGVPSIGKVEFDASPLEGMSGQEADHWENGTIAGFR